jgi:hypothetical protein
VFWETVGKTGYSGDKSGYSGYKPGYSDDKPGLKSPFGSGPGMAIPAEILP